MIRPSSPLTMLLSRHTRRREYGAVLVAPPDSQRKPSRLSQDERRFRLRQINRNLQNSWFQGLTFLCLNGGYGNVQLLQGRVDIIPKTVGLLPIGGMVRTEPYLVCPYC